MERGPRSGRGHWGLELCRRHCVGGGAPVNFGRRRRRVAGPNKSAAAARRGVGG